jgi:hypothetical protein
MAKSGKTASASTSGVSKLDEPALLTVAPQRTQSAA